MPLVSVDQNNGTIEEDKSNVVDAKPSQVRTLPNGLIIEVLEMGREDGKIAAPGRKISISYTGKLKDNGEVFESNIGHSPLKFRLGKGDVIQGWNVGLEVEKIDSKLSAWKQLTLSTAGRITLVNSVIFAIPTYYMQDVILSTSILNKIKQTERSFIWG
ncbi:FKBP-type peptidyl-prolyl cis-trans isomerase [Senna tora]|uniref:peptidylprolyl isomerase n=1 Tax=Senna tora TaxID=362788 RepID=A0A834W2W1_9FABA|nr:FKBP-type peptidyl-prolyl cis-trans isomerase [Senna tora]